MNEIIIFIKDNITWIQSFFSIIFTFVATIVGILTYRRAKTTILQPIRSEVIKKQTELLSKLLKFTNEDVDYMSILRINVYSYLQEYGFVFKEDKIIRENIEANKVGSIIFSNKDKLETVEVLETFSEDLTQEEIEKNKKEKYDLAKQGIINIEQIWYDRKFAEYNEKLDLFINDPFMPKKFIGILREMDKNISFNIGPILKETLEEFFREYIGRTKEGKLNFNIYGLYNTYHRKFAENDECIKRLREETRKLLYIDYEWK